MTYREMEPTPPARQWGWAVRRALLWAVRVVCLIAGIAMGAKGCSAFTAWADENDRTERERYEAAKRGRIAACVARGGTWNEGDVGGKPSEWCAGVRR